MSEPKRVVPQSLEFPDSLGHATKKEKKREKGKQLAPSFRFAISLPQTTDKSYFEFNYSQLVKTEEKKRRKEELRNETATNGLDPFDDADDDEDKLRDMAKRFEAKYGTATAGRKRHKYDDYVDLGAGYDENDSFIDNTDAYDEIVPVEVTTAYGGFYINSGALEFKPTDGNSPVHSRLNNNNNNNEEESSEDSADEDEDEGSRTLKRLEKRILSSSEDEEDDDNAGDPPRKKYKPEENGNKKSNHEKIMKKKRKLQPEQSNQQSDDCEMLNSRKNPTDDKREILDLECSSEDQEERKRAKYDAMKTKGDKKKFDVKNFVKKSSSNGIDSKKIDLKKFGGKDSNIDDAIESVVNAGRVVDESSTDTMDSVKSRGLGGTESECDETDKEETPLPEPLPDDIKDIINKLKVQAENHKQKEGKNKFFDEFVNSTLLTLDEKLRMLNSPSARVLTYGHLAHFLPCKKVTLVNRAKILSLQDAEKRVRIPFQRLKVIVDGIMPSVIERHAKESQRVADEKGLEGSTAEGESSDADADKPRIPRKKFPWTPETEKLVHDIACARRHDFKLRKPRKESFDTYLSSYMEAKVLPLWPRGWMSLRSLMKHSNPEPAEKRKSKKSRDPTVSNSVSGSSVTNSTPRSEVPNSIVANSVNTVGQERAVSPTNLSKPTVENPINFSMTAHSVKSSDSAESRKPSVSSGKHRDKNDEVLSSGKHRDKNDEVLMLGHQENASSGNGQSTAKITVVPTAQLMAQKPVKSITEKFNPMDLTSSSLSITPVNDYQKSNKPPSETKKDVISITPYNEPSSNIPSMNDSVVVSSTVPATRPEAASYGLPNSSGATTKSVTSKYRILQDSVESTSDKRTEDRVEVEAHRKEKRRDRWPDEKHRSHESKKRRKEHKLLESSLPQQQSASSKPEAATNATPQSSLTKEEQEQRQIEETVAATNFISQIINDDSPRVASDKRKEQPVADVVTENIGNAAQQPSEQDNNVQMVMRSLKELQELQEMKNSPNHSPGAQKASKSNNQYVGYQDDYPHLYSKKDDKMRVQKEESPW